MPETILPAAAGLSVTLMLVFWLWYRRLGNAGLVDVGWAVGLVGVSLLYAAAGIGDPRRKWLMAAMVTLWGARLAVYLLRDRIVARSEDPALLLSAMHTLVTYLDEAGYSQHAAGLLERLRELHEAAPGDLNLIRLRWLEGKIAAGLGKQVEARAALNGVRREFLAKGMLYDAAVVALELAALYAEAGWTFEVEKLAEEMYPVFISRDLPREASATLLLFVDAVNRRAATAEWIRKLAADLKRERKGG